MLAQRLAACAEELNDNKYRVRLPNLGRHSVASDVARALEDVVKILHEAIPTLADGANHLILSDFRKESDTKITIQASFQHGHIAQHGRKENTKVPKQHLQDKPLTEGADLPSMPKGVSITKRNNTLVISISA